ncbi:MAG: hypothetical protein GY790_16385 [Bacteroidetes bacterium]|nr:hypothetical protein [Bacteroidota bacterium]
MKFSLLKQSILLMFLSALSLSLHSQVVFKADVNTAGKTIPNVWDSQIIWFWGDNFLDKADAYPANYLVERFPFLERVELQIATGGEIAGYPGCSDKTRDQFVDPYHPEKGYDFSPLVRACENIVRLGIKPLIKVGSVPVFFTKEHAISKPFYINVRPPDDFDQYYDYVKSMAEEMEKTFGLEEITSWQWGFIAEYNNSSMFITADSVHENSKNELNKLYDYTVAGLEAVMGSGNVMMQIHPCPKCGPAKIFPSEALIEHCATGTNYYTGKIGTPMHSVVTSYYSRWNTTPDDFGESNERLQKVAESVGLNDLVYGIGEEGTIFDGEGVQLLGGISGHPFETSLSAAKFKHALDHNLSSITRWSWSSNRMFGIIDMPLNNLAKLSHKMAGDQKMDVVRSGAAKHADNQLESVVSLNSEGDKIRVLIYNHNKDWLSEVDDEYRIILDNIPGKDRKVKVSQWRVDEDHSNFWNTWWEEQGKDVELGPMEGEYGMAGHISISPFDSFAVEAFENEEDREFFMENLERYKELNKLMDPLKSKARIKDNVLTLEGMVKHHGLVFYEIEF